MSRVSDTIILPKNQTFEVTIIVTVLFIVVRTMGVVTKEI